MARTWPVKGCCRRGRVDWSWLVSLVLICVLVSGVTVAAMMAVGRAAQPVAADVIIVLGARVYPDRLSASLLARLETGLDLYQAGYAEHIIVSGGRGADEPTTEAYAMRDYLVSRGVNPNVIYLDEESFSTLDNLRNSQAIMEDQAWDDALLVTSDYHVLRSKLIARRLGMSVTPAAAPLPVPNVLRWQMMIREIAALWKDLILLPWYER